MSIPKIYPVQIGRFALGNPHDFGANGATYHWRSLTRTSWVYWFLPFGIFWRTDADKR